MRDADGRRARGARRHGQDGRHAVEGVGVAGGGGVGRDGRRQGATETELIDTGAACQMAPCGTLDDPERWRQAWRLWSLGALVAAVAVAFILAPRRPSSRSVLLLVVSAGLVVVPVAVLALVLSVIISVHGGATAVVVAPLVGARCSVRGCWHGGSW